MMRSKLICRALWSLGLFLAAVPGCTKSESRETSSDAGPAGTGGAPSGGQGAGASMSRGGGGVSSAGSGGAAITGNRGGSPASSGGASSSGGAPSTGGAPAIGDGGTANGHDAGSPGVGDTGAPTPGPSEGDVHIVKRMGDPTFDSVVTKPSPSTVTWLNDHFYRMEVFTTFFDDKTSFYPNGWVYSDSQVIYPGSSTAKNHPDWVLQDSGGHSVYLDWNCSGGTCPQYAADVTSAAFRSDWIATLKASLAKGYRGAWIDDVNLALRFSDGTKSVTAYSPATKAVVTEDSWSAAVASFMAEIAAALPSYELLHNSIWYARPTRTADTYVKQEMKAASVINLEGGFASDGGLTGGTGEWSVYAKMAFVDVVHSAGKWAVIDDFPSNDGERQYALACYLLVSNGSDGLGDAAMAPSTWWKGYDVHLGAAVSGRTRSATGVFRRQFQNGLVLMLEPGAASTTVTLPGPYTTIDGAEVTEVKLSAKQGAVLIAK